MAAPSYNPDNPEKVGPWGSKTGTFWSYKPNRPIQKIVVRYVGIFNSIRFEALNEEGVVETTGRYGGVGGQKDAEIQLDWPNEYLTGIKGTLDTVDGKYCVESITFLTNQREYGPYGTTNGTPYEFTVLDHLIVGFFGRVSGTYFVDAIGVYVKRAEDVMGSPTQAITSKVGSASTKSKEDDKP